MKAFHFVLRDGERGTLAGCEETMSLADARAEIDWVYRGRVKEVREAGAARTGPERKDLGIGIKQITEFLKNLEG